MEDVVRMDDDDLKLMHIELPGHRQRLLASIAYLRNLPSALVATAATATTATESVAAAAADRGTDAAAVQLPESDARAVPASAPTESVAAPDTPNAPAASETPSQAATNVASATTPASATADTAAAAAAPSTPAGASAAAEDAPGEGLVHSEEALNSGVVQYTAQYLGSRVSSVFGSAKATIKAVAKMRASGKIILNKPPIALNITTSAIRFLDPAAQTVIVSHDMETVKHPAQDSKDAAMFAYLTSQNKPDGSLRYLCHAFRVESELLASDIVATMEQAQQVRRGRLFKGKERVKPGR